ncbi:hypothetical protein lerEdw1_007363 [Lerista edwardsae]|nr:hypothetical protein lerEdw1_007363 [Lerista edwardsae]
MSASAIRRKSYKKAQEDAGPFSPVHWEGDGGGGGAEVPAGKLQVMEKFFTPVPQAPEGKGGSDVALWGCRQPWPESRSDRFSTLSSSSSASASSASRSSASWSSATSLDKEAYLPTGPRRHSQSCVDVSGEGRAFRRGRAEEAAYQGGEAGGSFTRLRRGQSKSADRLPPRQGHQEGPPLPGDADGVDRHLCKATSLERSLVFNEQTEILALRQPHHAGVPAPSKGILKNGAAAATADRLRKANSIETITVRPAGREFSPGPGPPRPLQRERQPPNSLDLSAPKKPPVPERMRLVEEKLRFSEFLNEITRQVLSPSSLSSLGWKPPEAAASSAGQTPSSSDGSEPKGGGGSKASSPGSFLETAAGRLEPKAAHGRRRLGQPEAKGDAHQQQRQASTAPARATDEASTSPELSPLPPPPSANVGSLPKQSAEAAKGQQKPAETAVRTGRECEGQEQPPGKAGQDAAEAPDPQERRVPSGAGADAPSPEGRNRIWVCDRPVGPAENLGGIGCIEGKIQQVRDGVSVVGGVELWFLNPSSLPFLHSRLQEDYSSTRHANQLLEEKLQMIAQTMSEERQALNRQIGELLERLAGAQNTICTLEKLNISGLLSGPSRKHQRHGKKAESPDSLSSLQMLDVAPPPAFMDGTSDARTTPSQSDSATEASKPGCSSESDTALPNGERSPLLEYAPLPEGPKRGHVRATAFTPWKQKSTKFSTDVNSTESECSGEEAVPVCPLPPPRFLYLRQEALAATLGPSAFPPLPTPELAAFEAVPPSNLPAGGQLELVPEISTSESSEDGEVSWSPGLVEKTSGSHLDYQSAQKMLDSLLHKSVAQEKHREKESRKAGRPGGYRVAAYPDGSGPGRFAGHQHRVRYYQDFPTPREEPCPPPGLGLLPRGTKGAAVGLEGSDAAQDSTSL